MKALVVDSSKSFRTMLAAVISETGLEVTQAGTGEEAIEILEKETYDLVCVSMFLKDMDGIEFSSRIRANLTEQYQQIIMVTSTEDLGTLNKALAVGVTEIFSKNDLGKIGDYVSNFVIRTGHYANIKGKILYVEDAKSVAAMTKVQLESYGLTVTHFITGDEAFAAFKDGDYDMVLTDVVLEGKMSGLGLVRAIRAMSGSKARTPILTFSAYDDDARKIELLRSGANDYVAKPTLEEELIARVANQINSKKLLDRIEAQQSRLHEIAMKDQLTGLYNRHYLTEMAPSMLSEAFRHNFPCSLIVIDADKFKSINDTHGHAVGDTVLQELGRVIKEAGRREDLAARFGGEEFVMLLSHCDAEDAVKKAEHLRQQIESLSPAGLDITASFGVAATNGKQKLEFTDLFKVADVAVYEAKGTGRNKVVLGHFSS